MDKELQELLQAQQENWARVEERLRALEKENATLREALAKNEEPAAPADVNTPAEKPGPAMDPPAPQSTGGAGAPSFAAAQATPAQTPATQAASPPGAQSPPPPVVPGGTAWAPPQGNLPPYAYGQTQYNPPPYPAPPPMGQAPATPGAATAFTPPPPPPQYGAAKKPKAEVEMSIGRITGIVGLMFILVGVVLALRYTYMHLLTSDWLKLGIAYLLGILFLGAGEVLSRRNKNAFSVSLLAGGVGICLATTAAGYFNLRALPALAACGICILVTAVSLALAMIHKSQLIGVFALVGGYMPMLAVDAMLTGPAKIYLLFLNLLVLFFAIDRDWKVLKCLSLACNTAALIYLFAIEAILSAGVFSATVVWDLVYLLGCFAIYMAACLLLAVRQKRNLTDLDTILIGVNTWAHFMLAQWVLTLHGVPKAGGVIALALSAGFWLFARASRTFLPRDHSARGLFYANSFVLLPIGIALLFSGNLQLYALLGTGAALWGAGIWGEKKWYGRAGGVLFALGVSRFLFQYMLPLRFNFIRTGRLAAILPYGVVVVLALLVLATLLYKHRQTVDQLPTPGRVPWQLYQAVTLAAACYYPIWLLGVLVPQRGDLFGGILLFLLPVLLRQIKYLRATGTTVVAALYTVFGQFFVTLICGIRYYDDRDPITLVLLALVYAAAVFGVACLLRGLPGGSLLRKKWLAPITVSLSLAYLTLYLTVWHDVAFNGMLLSILYLLAALACVVVGFAKLKTVLRRYGLVVLYLSITKLFLLDLAFLASGQRILSYFVFGFALLGISWVYQHYEKQLKETEE